MRSSRLRAVTVAALPFLAGCQAYVPSSRPLAPSAEVVRVPLVRPQAVVLARDAGAGAARADTIRGVTALYGRILELRGDTLRLAVTQVGRSGALQHFPSGPHAAVTLAEITVVERMGYSEQRTRALGVTFGVAVVAAAVVWAMFVAAVQG